MTTRTKNKQGKPTVNERLKGSKSFSTGPYKTAHVAHSYASQVRRQIRDNGLAGWTVRVTDDNTVRVFRAK